MTTRMMDIKADDKSGTFQGYVSLPASGKGPGLVIAQEIFGVNISMREVADYYAQEGYVVLVPDLFWRQEAGVQLGYTPADWQRAFDGSWRGTCRRFGRCSWLPKRLPM